MESMGPFSDRYLKSKESGNTEDEKYYYQILNISKNIYEVKIYPGLSTIEHSFDRDYQESLQFLLGGENYQHFQNFELINPLEMTCKNIQLSICLPDNCTDIITTFIEKKIPYYILNDIINTWYQTFKSKIEIILEDNKFDRNWYDLGSDDYNWACDTIRNCQQALKEVQEKLTKSKHCNKSKYKDRKKIPL